MLAVERTAELAGHEERVADGGGLTGEDAVGETLDGERADEGAVRAAADVAADDAQAGLGRGASRPMGEVGQPRRIDVGADHEGEQSIGGHGSGRGEIAEVAIHQLGARADPVASGIEVSSQDHRVDRARADGAATSVRQVRAIAAGAFGEGRRGFGERLHHATDEFFLGQLGDRTVRDGGEGSHGLRAWRRSGPVSTRVSSRR